MRNPKVLLALSTVIGYFTKVPMLQGGIMGEMSQATMHEILHGRDN